MEQQPPINTNRQEELATFQAEIFELKKEEEKGGETIHLKDCNPIELLEEDRILYDKYKSDYFTFAKLKEFEQYQGKRKYDNKSQKVFTEYISNMLTNKFYKDNLAQARNKN